MTKSLTDTKTLDINTNLAELNQNLEANKLSLEEAQALTHLGSWQWDVADGKISWSDELYRIYGLEPGVQDMGFEEFLQLIHPDDRQRVGDLIGSASQTGNDFEFEHRIILPNKKIRILHGKGKSDHDKDGNLLRMFGTSQDITERKKTERALLESDERFKAVTMATSDIVYDYDIQKNQVWFNRALSEEYGYPKTKTNKDYSWWLDRIHPQDQKRIAQSIKDFLEGSTDKWVEEYQVKKYDGTYVDIRDRAYLQRDISNAPIRMIGSILDITQQKELERAKDKFISLVSHQLLTPLTSMRLLAEMLASGYGGKLSKMQSDFINKIDTSTIRMIQLVGDILNVSQIEHGRIKVMPVSTDLNTLIQWQIDEVMPLTNDKKVEISYLPAKNLPLISVDPILYGQIVHNLLINAIRYSDKQKSSVDVKLEKSDEGYLLSVTDKGIGVPKTAQSRILTSFYRATNAVKMHGDGSGLGLYLIKLVLEATGGKIWFDSIEGKGSVFYVWLPDEGMKLREGDKTLLQQAYE